MNRKNISIWILGVILSYISFSSIPETQSFSLLTKPIFEKTSFGNKDNPFERIEYENRMLQNPATGKIPENIRQKELLFAKQLPHVHMDNLKKNNKFTSLTWIKRGPINRGGRTRALGIDVRTQTPGSITIIAGGVSGGIYKSTNDGQTWVDKLSPSSIHSVTCLTQDIRTGHKDTWYAGTGEAHGSASGGGAGFWGDGIFKSTDNGESWNLLASTSNGQVQRFNTAFRFVNNIAVNKSTGSIFAATSNVINRSTNGGTTWTTVRGVLANNLMSEIQITNTGILYAAIPAGLTNAGISKSTDDGSSWTTITPSGFPTIFKRTVIAIAPSNENIIYFFVYTPGQGTTQTQLWKYNASDNSWTNLTDNLPTIGGKVGTLNVQSSYDMVIKVKPDDANFVILGGTNLYRSIDGFSSKVNSAGWIGGYATVNNVSQYANHHPDQHSLVFLNSPNEIVLYSGHDGGLSKTIDITKSTVVWSDLNTGYVTSQFYSLAVDPTSSNSDIIIGGMQDNGNYFVNSANGDTPWTKLPLGGDGGFTAITNGHTDYYFETQKGNIWRFKLDANGSYTNFAKVQPSYSTSYLFINPFILDPNNNKIMYMAVGDSVWRNSDLTGIALGNQSATNVNWSALTNSKTGSFVSALSGSKSPANRLYIGSGNGKILKIDGANSGDPTAVDISTGKGLPANGYVNCFYVDPDNVDKVIVVFSNYSIPSLFFTQNGGSSWTDISGNLEQNSDGSGNGPSCRWVTKLTFSGVTNYYAATSTGLYSTTTLNGSSTIWVQEGANTIGNVVCPMVTSRSADGLVAVATHGAGIFSSIQLATEVDNQGIFPEKFKLYQNYPNPFNPSTIIKYSIPEIKTGLIQSVQLTIYDVLGREVAALVNKKQGSGNYQVTFNAKNLPSGLYLYTLTSNKFTQTKKMILLK